MLRTASRLGKICVVILIAILDERVGGTMRKLA
jgi:hypothetical protein